MGTIGHCFLKCEAFFQSSENFGNLTEEIKVQIRYESPIGTLGVTALRCARVAPSRTLATTATKRENILTFLPIIPDPFLPGWNGLAWVFMWRYFGKNKGGPKYASIAKMKAGNTIIWLGVAGLAVLFFASEWHGKDILEWVPLYNIKYTREKIPEMS